MTIPETCGTAGGAVSLWMDVPDCNPRWAWRIYHIPSIAGPGFLIYQTPHTRRHSSNIIHDIIEV